MARTDPKYVRLAEHMANRIVADIEGGSGWSISGMQVKTFPDEETEPTACRYVRSQLVAGLLEPAGKAEYDEVLAGNRAMEEAAGRGGSNGPSQGEESAGGLQEAQVQEAGRQVAGNLAKKRAASTEGS